MSAQHPPLWRESLAPRALILAAAVGFGASPLASTLGWSTAALGVLAATPLARLALARRLRTLPALALGVVIGLLGGFASESLLNSPALAGFIGPSAAIGASEVLFWFLTMAGLWGALRVLSLRTRLFTALEAALGLAALAWPLASHRELTLSRPRAFSDWAWTRGTEPTDWLLIFGVLAGVALSVLWIRKGPRRKQIGGILAALALALLVFGIARTIHLEPPPDSNGLNLTQAEQDEEKENDEERTRNQGGAGDKDRDAKRNGESGGDDPADGKPDGEGDEGDTDKDGEGGGGGGDQKSDGSGGSGGQSQDEGDGEGGGGGGVDGESSPNPQTPPNPSPIAVAIFHDEYTPDAPVLYFRQQVLSHYDGNHLVADPSGRHDRDVINAFPAGPDASIFGADTQREGAHQEVPTTVYLMVDHPQPIALTHAAKITNIPNPNPARFVAAYTVKSMAPNVTARRLVGRQAIPEDWTDETRAHYLATPDDPRYASLADEIIRDADPRFTHDPLFTALTLKQWLEKKGFYTRKETHTSDTDPTASFLFGSRRGYCVHFAHSAAFLFRSQGIPARVAVGYAVDAPSRESGSSMVIMNNQAHAWPEIHLAGIGWLPFDIYPERSDEAPRPPVDQDLAVLLGEMARKDSAPFQDETSLFGPIPWGPIALTVLGLLLSALAILFGIKVYRRKLSLGRPLRAALDALSDYGITRTPGETRHAMALRLAERTPSLGPLTDAHLRLALGPPAPARAIGSENSPPNLARLSAAVRAECRAGQPISGRLKADLNPIGWLRTR